MEGECSGIRGGWVSDSTALYINITCVCVNKTFAQQTHAWRFEVGIGNADFNR